MSTEVRVFAHARGNVYMRQIADLIVGEMERLGLTARLVTRGIPGRSNTLDVVVAPHEYTFLEPGLSGDRAVEVLSRCVALTTEQPGTAWFDANVALCRQCPVVVDVSQVAAESMAAAGLPAEALKWGYTPHWDRWGGGEIGERPLDVVLLAAVTEHREKMLARVAPVLAEWRTRLHLFDNSRPVLESDPWFVGGEALWSLMRSSRVLLNIRRDPDRAYFEWIRFLPAVLNGAVIVTEPSYGAAPLEPFRHFVVGREATLAAQLTVLLDNEVSRAKMALDAYEALRSAPPFAESVRRLVDRGAEALNRKVSWRADVPSLDVPRSDTQAVLAPGWVGVAYEDPDRVFVEEGDDLGAVADRIARCETSTVMLARTGDLFFPRGVVALAEALASDVGAVGAYGPVRLRTDRLSHHLPWDRSRLCRTPFLRVTALVRRDAFVGALRAADALVRRHQVTGDYLDDAWYWHLPWLILASRGYSVASVPAMIATSDTAVEQCGAPLWLHEVVLRGSWPTDAERRPGGRERNDERLAS